jgi:hypothetical protein
MGIPFRLLPGGFRTGGVAEFAVALGVFALALCELYLLYPALGGTLLQPL